MIAVVGRVASGSGVPIARRIAAAGADAQLVATVPPGDTGDRRLAELAAAGVGHAAALRSPSPALDGADLQLALRYLPDVRVVVIASDAAALAAAAADAAAWSGAALVVVTSPGEPALEARAESLERAIVVEAPASDPDEAFAGLVAGLAARLDAGQSPDDAWRGVAQAVGLESVSPDPASRPAGPPSGPR